MTVMRCLAVIILLLAVCAPTFAEGHRGGDREVRFSSAAPVGPAAPVESIADAVSFRNCMNTAVEQCGVNNIDEFEHRSGFLGIGSSCSFTCGDE
ncbi:MAG: hypothetical protein AAF604_18960 [Acidobacteriota bacterium]